MSLAGAQARRIRIKGRAAEFALLEMNKAPVIIPEALCFKAQLQFISRRHLFHRLIRLLDSLADVSGIRPSGLREVRLAAALAAYHRREPLYNLSGAVLVRQVPCNGSEKQRLRVLRRPEHHYA